MKKLLTHIKALIVVARRYISPVFLAMVAVSFTMWYISKLGYTYTTDLNVKVKVDGQRIEVPCVVEGKGTNLIGYGLYISRRMNIPLSELVYDTISVPVVSEDGGEPTMERKVAITPASMRDAISVRFSDIKIRSIGEIPYLNIPDKE